ncbi:MAG: hypothetical protein HMLKMBBP_03242 [Planctomycetes bacterium]|nr:hypothetical protein [Planctomycetota bacterium]
MLHVSRWPVPAALAASALVAAAFAWRNEIGAWRANDSEKEIADAGARGPRVGSRGSALTPPPRKPRATAHGGNYRGPEGEVPPDSREPSDPAPAPEAAGAGTPMGPASGPGGLIPSGGDRVRGRSGGAPGGGGGGGGGPGAERDGLTLEFERSSRLFDGELSTGEYDAAIAGAATSIFTAAGGSAVEGTFVPGAAKNPDGVVIRFAESAQKLPAKQAEVLLVAEELKKVAFTREALLGGANGAAPAADPAVAAQLGRLRQLGYVADIDLPSGGIVVRPDNTPPSPHDRAGYAAFHDNAFTKVADAPLSTFGTDVDTASWSNIRRILRQGALPPPGAVRIEEMLNTFAYSYAPPTDGDAFALHVETAGCPWNAQSRLVRVGLKGREVQTTERPSANLVFLLDVSGSMGPQNRLPLVKESMKLLVEKLDGRDRVAIVVYAGASGLVLPSTSCEKKADILAALDRLQSGGSTNGAAGIELAYRTAAESFIPGGINRVILATDGDFNVGVTDDGSLVRMIQEKAKSKVFLSVLGVGDDNLQDHKMEQLANKGNGVYAYLDSIDEGRRVLSDQASATLQTIAKDVKVQVEFNPLAVASYRLIGYENRVMAAQDFADDTKDAGDVGAGHTVTALYEIVPAASATTAASATEPLRYQQGPRPSDAAHSGELLTVKLRWKLPEGDVSTLRERAVVDSGLGYAQASGDFKFAAAVAGFGMILRNSPHKGTATLDAVHELAGEAVEGPTAQDTDRRKELLELVGRAKALLK